MYTDDNIRMGKDTIYSRKECELPQTYQKQADNITK